MKTIAMLSLFVLASAASAETLFRVPWGKGPGQVGYHNPSTPPFDQPYAEGPGGLALGPGNEIWIADQFNDRILRFDRAGKLVGMIGKVGEERLSRPRALAVDPGRAVAVVSSTDMVVLWLDQKTRKLDRLKALERKDASFSQVEALIATPDELWAGDFIENALLHFKRGAPPVRRPWQLSGVARDAAGRVWTLDYRAPSGAKPDHWLVSTDEKGKSTDHFALQTPELENPYLVGLDAKGNAIIRFTKIGDPRAENPNRFVLVRFELSTRQGTPIGETLVSVVNQQFAVTAEGTVIGLSFDAMQAPSGEIEVIEFR